LLANDTSPRKALKRLPLQRRMAARKRMEKIDAGDRSKLRRSTPCPANLNAWSNAAGDRCRQRWMVF